MSSHPAGLGQSHRQHRRSPGAQAAELCRVWWELCVREHQARDRNHQLLQDFEHLETQLGLLWAKTDTVRRRKVDYEEFLQRLLQSQKMEAESPGQVPQCQVGTACSQEPSRVRGRIGASINCEDWVSAWMLELPLRSRPGRHLPEPPERMDHLRYQTPWPHPVSPQAQSPEPAAFFASTGAATRPTGGPHCTLGLHRRLITKDAGYGLPTPMRCQESATLLPPRRLRFPSTAELKGVNPQPTQPRACAGVGSYTEDAISFGMGRQDQAANRASRRLLWRGTGEKDSTETACEESWDRIPRLWHKEKSGRDTTPLDQGGSWGQESWGEQEGDDRPEETSGSLWCRLSVRGRESGRNRDPGEGVQLKGEVRYVLVRGAGQLKEGEGTSGDGCLAMGQIQEEGEEEEGLVGVQGGQEVGKKNEEGNREERSGGIREEAEGRGSKEDSTLGQVQASANGQEDEEGLVKRGGQEKGDKEEGLAGAQGVEEEDSKREEGLVVGQEGNMEEECLVKALRGQIGAKEGETEEEEEEEALTGWETQDRGKEEEGLAGWSGQEQGEEEKGSEEEEGLMGCEDQEQGKKEEGSEEEEGQAGQRGQEQGEEEKGSEEEEGQAGCRGQEQVEEDDGSEQEEGLVGQQGGQEGGEEDEGSEGLAVGDAEGHVQEEEEDEDSDLVLGLQGGPGNVELGRCRGGGRDSPAWNSCTLKAAHEGTELGQDSAREEEEEAESEADEAIEAALAPSGNTTEPRAKGRALECHELRRASQGSPPLQERSREADDQGFWGDQEEVETDLETSPREDQSLDDQDNFYD